MTITVTRHDAGATGEYHAAVEGSGAIGRLTYVRHGDLLVAEHTLVPPAIGGRGVAAKLVEVLMADARSEGFRVDPRCSYVDAAFRKHPEWSDLRA